MFCCPLTSVATSAMEIQQILMVQIWTDTIKSKKQTVAKTLQLNCLCHMQINLCCFGVKLSFPMYLNFLPQSQCQ